MACARVWGSESEAGAGVPLLGLGVWTQGPADGPKPALAPVPPLPVEYPGGAGEAGGTGSSRLSAEASSSQHPHTLPGEEDAHIDALEMGPEAAKKLAQGHTGHCGRGMAMPERAWRRSRAPEGQSGVCRGSGRVRGQVPDES